MPDIPNSITKQINAPFYVSTGSEIITLGDWTLAGGVKLNTFNIQVSGSGLYTGSLFPQKGIGGCQTLISSSYTNLSTGATVTGSTPINTSGIYSIAGNGCTTFLSHSWTAGTSSIYLNVTS